MVFSGMVNCILCSKYINLQTGQPICTAFLPYTKNPISIHLSAPLSLVSESCPRVIHSGGTREGVRRGPLCLYQTEARKRNRVQHLHVRTACVTVIFKTLNQIKSFSLKHEPRKRQILLKVFTCKLRDNTTHSEPSEANPAEVTFMPVLHEKRACPEPPFLYTDWKQCA